MFDFAFALGFIAGEGTFTLSMNTADGKHYPRMRFQVRVHENDEGGLCSCRDAVQRAAGQELGSWYDIEGRDTVEWVITSKDELGVLHDTIREHAPEAWRETEKYRNFETWSDILNIHLGGRTTAAQAVEMAKMARDGLNVNNGINRQRWNEYIESLEERA